MPPPPPPSATAAAPGRRRSCMQPPSLPAATAPSRCRQCRSPLPSPPPAAAASAPGRCHRRPQPLPAPPQAAAAAASGPTGKHSRITRKYGRRFRDPQEIWDPEDCAWNPVDRRTIMEPSRRHSIVGRTRENCGRLWKRPRTAFHCKPGSFHLGGGIVCRQPAPGELDRAHKYGGMRRHLYPTTVPSNFTPTACRFRAPPSGLTPTGGSIHQRIPPHPLTPILPRTSRPHG